MRIKPVAIISLILMICVYLVLGADPSHQIDAEITDGETTIRENNPSDSLSASIQVTAKLRREQANPATTGIDNSTASTDSDAADVIIIGSYADPDDSSPLGREDRDLIRIGVVLNANNDEGWPPREDVTPISKGDIIDANTVGFEDSTADKEAISIGEPLDVERFLAGGYTAPINQDRTPISIGEKIEVPK